MDTKRASDFSVESKGYCFLCLQKISSPLNPVKLDSTIAISSSVYSLQEISRYLKLDMRKVFIQGGPVPPHLLAKVEKSRLKVELCEECAAVTENISSQCRQLEKLRMEIESGLGSIHVKMAGADETGRTQQFQRAAGSELSSGLGGWMEILEVLRFEAMEKCSRMMNTTPPRPQIQKLTNEEIRRKTFRIPRKEDETISERLPDPGLQRNSGFKMEESDIVVDWALNDDHDDDNHCENSFGDDLNGNLDDAIPTLVKDEGATIEGEVTSGKVVPTSKTETGKNQQRTWAINSKTGKYKCNLCAKEYASTPGIYHHYNTVHRKVRFKCKICGNEFTQKCHYKTHHQSVHMGVRFECQVCKKTFSEKGNLIKHQRRKVCVSGHEKLT